MTKKFLIIDTSHLLHRTRHTTRGDIWTQVGLSLHIIFNSIRKCWREFDADHVVFCLEGKSWRSSIYEPYKQNRKARRLLKSTQEIEDDEIFREIDRAKMMETLSDLMEYPPPDLTSITDDELTQRIEELMLVEVMFEAAQELNPAQMESFEASSKRRELF